MSGRTDLVVNYLNGRFIHVPIGMAIERKQRIDPEGELWASVLAATGQPARFGD
jgi:6-phosphofructokinase 1